PTAPTVGSAKCGRARSTHEGAITQSASTNATTSAAASRTPRFRSAATVNPGAVTTWAPQARAIGTVRSVEPLSITRISPSWPAPTIAPRQRSSVASTLSAGTTKVITGLADGLESMALLAPLEVAEHGVEPRELVVPLVVVANERGGGARDPFPALAI